MCIRDRTYTINPKPKDSDLTIKKTRSEPKDGKITYTVTASSEKGTDDDQVKIVDRLTYSGLENVTVGKPIVKKGNSEISYNDSDYEIKNGTGFSEYTLKLHALGAGAVSYTHLMKLLSRRAASKCRKYSQRPWSQSLYRDCILQANY